MQSWSKIHWEMFYFIMCVSIHLLYFHSLQICTLKTWSVNTRRGKKVGLWVKNQHAKWMNNDLCVMRQWGDDFNKWNKQKCHISSHFPHFSLFDLWNGLLNDLIPLCLLFIIISLRSWRGAQNQLQETECWTLCVCVCVGFFLTFVIFWIDWPFTVATTSEYNWCSRAH